MKKILRHFLINAGAIWIATRILPAFIYEGGVHTLLVGTVLLMAINFLIIPLIKIMLLPLNLLTLGLFAWIANVIGLYLLTVIMPQFKIIPYSYPGAHINGFIIPAVSLNILQVAIVASLLIGIMSQFLKWVID
jgi:putative membrane protein